MVSSHGKNKKADKNTKFLAHNIYQALLIAFLLGVNHILEDITLEFDENNLANIITFGVDLEEAERFFLMKVPLTKEKYEKLSNKLKFRAFMVARLIELDAIERTREVLYKALVEGLTLKEFWETAGKDELLRKAGFHRSNSWYWGIVSRTNIQSVYNARRALQIAKAKNVEYLEFVGIGDMRQIPMCRQRIGIIKPKNDLFWRSNLPLLHFGCRSTVRVIQSMKLSTLE